MMLTLISDWHKQQLGTIYGLDGGIVMGCPLWGKGFTDHFLDYCLPSLMANRVN